MGIEELGKAKILLIDEDEKRLADLEGKLREAGVSQTVAIRQSGQATEAFMDVQPDLVMIGLSRSLPDGAALVNQFRSSDRAGARIVPVILITSETGAAASQAMRVGSDDFIEMGVETPELIENIRSIVAGHRLYRKVNLERSHLEDTVRLRTAELHSARRQVLDRLAIAAEYRDDQTGEHTRRVGQLSERIARALGKNDSYSEAIAAAALLHDVGKIGIPDRILLKPGPLDPDEWEIMKTHPTIGASILSDCDEPVMQMACEIALTHHERWDGRGYPTGLRGLEIPLAGRIVSVADSYDAMTSERPYKAAKSHEWAMAELEAMAGKQFDPALVQAFAASWEAGPILSDRCVVEVEQLELAL